MIFKYKYTERYKKHLLKKFLQVGDVPSSWNRPSFQSGQTVDILSSLPSDFVGAFLVGTQLSLTWVLHVAQGLAEDKVPNPQSMRLDLLVVEAGQLPLVGLEPHQGSFTSFFSKVLLDFQCGAVSSLLD